MLKVRRLILNLFLLVLRVLFDSVPGAVHKSPGVSKVLTEKRLKLDPRQGTIGLLWELVLVQIKVDLTTKE